MQSISVSLLSKGTDYLLQKMPAQACDLMYISLQTEEVAAKGHLNIILIRLK